MKRGDVVIVATGKPRPAVVVQDDAFVTPLEVLLCPITTTLVDASLFRPSIAATTKNGLESDSQAMVDKLGPFRRDRVSRVVGHLDAEDMQRITQSTALILGIGR